MIDRYLTYLSSVRRYSPRTVEIYRGVLEEFFAFVSGDASFRVSPGLQTSGDAGPLPPTASAGPSLLRSRGWLRSADPAAASTPPPENASNQTLPLGEVLTVQMVRSYEVYLMDEKGEGARTVGLHMSVLSGFCKYLMREGVLESNPVRLVARPKQEKRLPVFYRDESMKAYFEQTKGVLEYGKYEDQLQRMILGMLFGTGIRRSELISLNRSSVDFSRQVLRVRGKGDKMREIPLPPSLCEEILLYLHAVDSLKCADTAPDAPLLQTPGGRRLYPVYVDRAVKAALGPVDGISGRKSPHVLRHTLATELLDGGADLNSIKELLGHSSLAATQVYTHNSIERLQHVYKSAHPRAKNDDHHGD